MRCQFEGALYSRVGFNPTDQLHYTTVPGFPAAVKLYSPRDEEVLDGYVESDLVNNTSPGLALIV